MFRYSPQQISDYRARIRSAYRAGKLTEEQVGRLNAVGFDFISRHLSAVVCVELGRLFESAATASRALDVVNKAGGANILSCCRGRILTAYGYHWRYATDEEIAAGKVLVTYPIVDDDKSRYAKPVVCIELGQLFESVAAAIRALNLPKGVHSSICKCCRGEQLSARNFHWRYATEEEIAVGRVLLESGDA